MFGFLLADGNLPFAVSLGLMLVIAILEGTLTLLGAGFSQVIDSLLPSSAGDIDIDASPDSDMSPDIADLSGNGADVGDTQAIGGSGLSKLLGWLCIGRVPMLALLVIFLTGFGLAGLFIQWVAQSTFGGFLPATAASIPAFLVAIPMVRVCGTGLARLIPKDESSAVTSSSLIGRIATIVIGTARQGQPAQAKVRDANGQTHYVMVEPDDDLTTFDAGTEVLLVNQSGARFHAILNSHSALTDP